MQGLKEAVTSLVESATRCGVSHCGLEGMVRSEYLKRAAALPKRPIVYNASYGDHELSPAFQKFIESYEDSQESYYKALGYGQFLCEIGFGVEDCTGRSHWARQSMSAADEPQLSSLLGLIASRTVKPLPSERDEVWEKVGLHFASGWFAELAVQWVPNGVSYRVEDYDGKETVVW